jgi:hypothetical protein
VKKRKYFRLTCAIVFLAITWLCLRWLVPMRERSDLASFDIAVRGAVVIGLEVKQSADSKSLLIQTPRGYPTYAFDTRTRQLKQAFHLHGKKLARLNLRHRSRRL